MLSRSFSAAGFFLCLVTALPASLIAQSTSQPQNQPKGSSKSGQLPGYTFEAGTRIVLTDVTVTDRKGNPVRGLKASDFRIFDNNKPQVLASFEEHTAAPVESAPQAPAAPGVYSNNFILHPPPVLDVIVIDITNIEIVDQMYLNYELTRFIKNLPPGEPIAVYWRIGPTSILLQSFTSDHTLLLNAVHRALPHFPPTGREYYSDFATLHQIALDLSQLPGRKNILWFTGGSTLYLHEDATVYEDRAAERLIYDELESGRIAIYPIDARGLTITSSTSMLQQHGLMQEIAYTTGGQAFYDNNGLDKIAARWVDNGGDFYTLTYSPSNFRFDNKWHKVHIKLNADGANYSLSYRSGYFADGSIGSAGEQHPLGRPRTRLLVNGDTVAEPDSKSLPIIFHVHILPLSQVPASVVAATAAVSSPRPQPRRGTSPYFIQYSLPADAFAIKSTDGKDEVIVGAAVFAFNDEGSPVTREVTQFTLAVNMQKLHSTPNAVLVVNQQIDLHNGQNYLYMALWDMGTGRLGTLQFPLKVTKEKD